MEHRDERAAELDEAVMLVVADIAGEFDALTRLVAQVPLDEKIILLGDMVDRGPHSCEVVKWAMSEPRVTALMGNHEHMLLDYWHGGDIYPRDCWEGNGGYSTVNSYRSEDNPRGRPPESHLTWLASLDSYYFSDDKKLFVSHAPLLVGYEPEQVANVTNFMDPLFDYSLLWNRRSPQPREFFQVFGHNSHWGLKQFAEANGEVWALCIDQSKKGILTGFHWPTGEILEAPYTVIKQRNLTPEESP